MDTEGLGSLGESQVGLLRRVTEAFRADGRVVSCWAGGSLGAGSADAWSDLDLNVMAAAEHFDALADRAYEVLLEAGEPLMHWPGLRTEGIACLGCFYSDGNHVDLVVHNAAHGAVFFSYPVRVLFGEEPRGDPEAQRPSLATPDRQAEVRRRIFQFWLSVAFAAKYIARGDCVMATGHLGGMLGGLVQLCDVSRAAPFGMPPPIAFATWGRLTPEEHRLLAGALPVTDGEALRGQFEALVAAARRLLGPIAEAASAADFAAAMDRAVMGWVDAASRAPQR